MKKLFPLLLVLLAACGGGREKQILVFYQPDAPGISQKIFEIMNITAKNSINVDTLSKLEQLNEKRLQNYSAIVLLEIPGENLNYKQQTDLERYIQSGGGVVGIDTDMRSKYQWPWYNAFLAQIEQYGEEDSFVAKQVSLTQNTQAQSHLTGTYQFDGGLYVFCPRQIVSS